MSRNRVLSDASSRARVAAVGDGSRSSRRIALAAAAAGLLMAGWLLVASHATAATVILTGQVTSETPADLSPNAVLVVTLFDQTATAKSGSIIGQKRLDDVAALPATFEVPYDEGRIEPDHSYAAMAAIVDGGTSLRSPMPVPVITGGPSKNLGLPLEVEPEHPAAITGVIATPDGVELTKSAVAIAVLIKEDKGTLVDVDTITAIGGGSIPFSLGFDPELVDPAARYVVRAGIVDAGHVWGTPEATEAITDGAPASNLALTLIERPEGIPVAPGPGGEASPLPSGLFQSIEPLPTGPLLPTREPGGPTEPAETTEPAGPTEAPPTAEPTRAPLRTLPPRPTEAPTPVPPPTPAPTEPPPTAAPTAPPAPTQPPPTVAPPTPAPPTVAPTLPPPTTPPATQTPTATPPPSPTPTVPPASPAASPTGPPAAGPTVTGTLTYREPAGLTADARVIVVLVEGPGRPTAGTVVASSVIHDPGQVPIAFELPYAGVDIDDGVTYTVAAAIVDGDHTWVTGGGTPVITKGNPTAGITLELEYIADVLKGAVTGSITGVDVDLGTDAFSAAVLLDLNSDTNVGIDVNPDPESVPIAFTVPFDPAAIDTESSYVVTAAIVGETDRWANLTGVPVITKGNPLVGVTVPVAVVITPEPSQTGLLGTILALLLLTGGVIAILLYMRSRPSMGIEIAALPPQPGPTAPKPTSTTEVPPPTRAEPPKPP